MIVIVAWKISCSSRTVDDDDYYDSYRKEKAC